MATTKTAGKTGKKRVGAPLGNKNGSKNRPWAEAIRISLAQTGNGKGLETIAKKVIAMAKAGDIHAIREIADRTDGKVKQVIGNDGEDGTQPFIIEVRR